MKTTSELLLEADANKPQKPTQEQYLNRAMHSFATLQTMEKGYGRPLTREDSVVRFVDASMWRSLMGWAGMPMTFHDE